MAISTQIKTKESEREVQELERYITDSTSQYTGAKGTKVRTIATAYITLLQSIVTNTHTAPERTLAITKLKESFDNARIAAFKP